MPIVLDVGDVESIAHHGMNHAKEEKMTSCWMPIVLDVATKPLPIVLDEPRPWHNHTKEENFAIVTAA